MFLIHTIFLAFLHSSTAIAGPLPAFANSTRASVAFAVASDQTTSASGRLPIKAYRVQDWQFASTATTSISTPETGYRPTSFSYSQGPSSAVRSDEGHRRTTIEIGASTSLLQSITSSTPLATLTTESYDPFYNFFPPASETTDCEATSSPTGEAMGARQSAHDVTSSYTTTDRQSTPLTASLQKPSATTLSSEPAVYGTLTLTYTYDTSSSASAASASTSASDVERPNSRHAKPTGYVQQTFTLPEVVTQLPRQSTYAFNSTTVSSSWRSSSSSTTTAGGGIVIIPIDPSGSSTGSVNRPAANAMAAGTWSA